MRASTFRRLMRTFHIIVGFAVDAYFYAPPLAGNEVYIAALKFVILPLVVITGIAMWQMKRLKGIAFS